MDFSYGFRAQVLGGLGPFFLLVLIPCFYVFVPFFFKRKTGPKKNGGGGTGCFPVLVWFSPGNRPPFRPLSEYGGPEGLLGSGFEFLRWRFCCGRGVCKWGVLRWMWFSFFRLGDWPAFWRGLGPSILICGDRMGGAGRRGSEALDGGLAASRHRPFFVGSSPVDRCFGSYFMGVLPLFLAFL